MPRTRSTSTQSSIDFPVRKLRARGNSCSKTTRDGVVKVSPSKENSPRKRRAEAENVSPATPEKIKKVANSPEKSTPASRRKLSLSLGRRSCSEYNQVKQALHTALPEELPCRENETKIITSFLKKHIKRHKPRSLYISGAPGTGKTACLKFAMNEIKDQSHSLCFVNCMSMKQSQNIYHKIASVITDGKLTFTNKQAKQFLEDHFTANGKMIVLVLDEIDHLESKNQDILYKIFEWPSLECSRVIVVGVANSLDLTDRILPRLHTVSHSQPKLLHFRPYQRDEIVKVLESRISVVETTVIDTKAVQFCARKVSSVAGDMRKALDIMRRAIDLVDTETRKQQILTPLDANSEHFKQPVAKAVGLPHVASVVAEVYGSRVTNACKTQGGTFPLQQKVVVCTLLLMARQLKVKEVKIEKLYQAYVHVCKSCQVTAVAQEDIISLCDLLEANGVVGVKKTTQYNSRMVNLRLQESEIEQALKDAMLLSSILALQLPSKLR